MPTDEKYPNWENAISIYSSAPYRGFICINHFIKDDLVVGKTKTSLKKDAVPKLFVACTPIIQITSTKKTNSTITSIPPMPSAPSAPSISCDKCESLKTEKQCIYQDYIELEAKRCIEIANLENTIKKLKMDAEIRKQHMKYLSAKVYRKEKSEESLKCLLEDLKAQNVLSSQAYEALKVCHIRHISLTLISILD